MDNGKLAKSVKCQWPEPGGCGNLTKHPSMMCFQHVGKTPDIPVDPWAGLKTPADQIQLSSRSASELNNDRLYHPYKQSREEQDILSGAILDTYDDPEQDRCQIQAACGLGKTIIHQQVIDGISERLLEQEGRGGTFVVMSPRKHLTGQLRSEYIEDGFANITDEDQSAIDGTVFSVHDESPDIKTITSTDPHQRRREERENLERLKDFLSHDNDTGRPRIVFIVDSPESIDKVATAQRELGHQFDGAIFDEAHNLTGIKGKPDSKGKAPQFSRVFLNEDPHGIQSDFRVFTTATIKDARSQSNDLFRETLHSAPRDTRSDYIDAAKMMDSGGASSRGVAMHQSDESMFGKVVGPRYGLQYAINQGLLVKPDIQVREVAIRGGDNVDVNRETPVSPSGQVMSRVDDSSLSLGTYQNIHMALSTLADDPDPEYLHNNDGPQRRNHLAFVNSVAEARAMSDRKKWSGVAQEMAKRQLDGRELTPSEADIVLSNPDHFGPRETRAARLVLLGQQAGVMPLDSTMTQSQQEASMNWLDQREPWDSDNGQVGKSYGGWSPQAKVLGNFDMVSEGINLPMVDTVAMNRPRKHQDEDIYQAVARSCRKAVKRDSSGNVVRDYKPSARVIVADTIQNTSRGQRRPDRMASSATLRSISRVWRANADANSDETYSGDDAAATRYSSSGVASQDHSSVFLEAESTLEADQIDPRAAAMLAESRKVVETKAKAQYRKDKPGSKWDDLSRQEKEARISTLASASVSGTGRSATLSAAYLRGVHEWGEDAPEIAESYLRDLRDRSRRDDWLDLERGETQAVEEYHDFVEEVRYGENTISARDRRKKAVESLMGVLRGGAR